MMLRVLWAKLVDRGTGMVRAMCFTELRPEMVAAQGQMLNLVLFVAEPSCCTPC